MKKRIYSDDDPVEKKVYEAYPVDKKEKRCAIHRAKMEAKRFELRKRLLDSAGNDIHDDPQTDHKAIH